MAQRLTNEQVKEILARAEEIHLREGDVLGSETELVIRAAEEAGLPREAVEKALRERLDLLVEPPRAGQLVFAKSADGKFYVAEVKETGASGTRVEFVKGGDTILQPDAMRSASFLPGQKLHCYWPVWGWWGSTVLKFNASTRKVKVDDGWGQEDWVPLDRVRLEPPRSQGLASRAKALWISYGFGVVTGLLASGLAWWIFLR